MVCIQQNIERLARSVSRCMRPNHRCRLMLAWGVGRLLSGYKIKKIILHNVIIRKYNWTIFYWFRSCFVSAHTRRFGSRSASMVLNLTILLPYAQTMVCDNCDNATSGTYSNPRIFTDLLLIDLSIEYNTAVFFFFDWSNAFFFVVRDVEYREKFTLITTKMWATATDARTARRYRAHDDTNGNGQLPS